MNYDEEFERALLRIWRDAPAVESGGVAGDPSSVPTTWTSAPVKAFRKAIVAADDPPRQVQWSTINSPTEWAAVGEESGATGSTGAAQDSWRGYFRGYDGFGLSNMPNNTEAERAAGAREERARILAAMEAMKPGEQPYTRKSWNDELIGERRMWARVMAAIDGKKGGE